MDTTERTEEPPSRPTDDPPRRWWVVAASIAVLVGSVGIAGAALDSGGGRSDDATAPGNWRVLAFSPLAARESAASVWTGEEWIIWGGAFVATTPTAGAEVHTEIDGPDGAGAYADGAAHDPATDTWRSIVAGPLRPRAEPFAAWTGAEMVVAGGRSGSVDLRDAAAYDPAADAWRTLPDLPGIVVGLEMIGGRLGALVTIGDDLDGWPGGLAVGLSAFDPTSGEWSEPADSGIAANALVALTASDTHLYVFDGLAVHALSLDGGVDLALTLDDAGDPVPNGRILDAGVVWTGSDLVLAGVDRHDENRPVWSVRHDPSTGITRPVPHDAGWGNGPTNAVLGDGFVVFTHTGPYEPVRVFSLATDTWGAAPDAPIDVGRQLPAVAWTGDELLVWGGRTATTLRDGITTEGRSQSDGAALTLTGVAAGDAR